ncbi:hypothetical protein DL764_008660 [Monosporascus ibericus]|uniref:Uncharacterized protein n=1 Tax=Monosporascus ibericus TaxID=155417 RepID=A0A4Q4SWX1_9PEZI|nr:hypothetical protein DL764_008660 [Monosporascus ibericus]
MFAKKMADASGQKPLKCRPTRIASRVRQRAASQLPEKEARATPTKRDATVQKPTIKSEEALQQIGLLTPLTETNLSSETTKDLTTRPPQRHPGNASNSRPTQAPLPSPLQIPQPNGEHRKHLERLRDRVLYLEEATATLGERQRTLGELDRRVQWIKKRELNRRLKEHEELAAVRKRHRAELRREEYTKKRSGKRGLRTWKKMFRYGALGRETREMASRGAQGGHEGETSLANSSGDGRLVSASELISSQSESDSDSSDSKSENDFESDSDSGW